MTDRDMQAECNTHWNSHSETIKGFMVYGTDDESIDDMLEEDAAFARGFFDNNGTWYDYGLAFDYVPALTFDDRPEGYWRYQISYGGPSEEIRFYATKDARGNWIMHRAEFWFLDWFTGAHINVTNSDEARWVWDQFNDTETVEHAHSQAMEG